MGKIIVISRANTDMVVNGKKLFLSGETLVDGDVKVTGKLGNKFFITIAYAGLLLLFFTVSFPQTNTSQVEKIPTFHQFEELSPNTIHPQGWIKEFLLRQKSGMTGQHYALGYPYNTNLWNGVLKRAGEYGDESWRYEQTGYLVDGIIRLGYLLNDKDLIKKGEDNVRYTLDNVKSDGRIGPEKTSEWPNAVFFRALKAYYLSTKNVMVLSVLEKHYLTIIPQELGRGRNIVNLEGILWLYGINGNLKLLELAEKSYETFNLPTNHSDDLTMSRCLSDSIIRMHGVSYMEQAKIPAILYAYTGKLQYLSAATNAFYKLDRDHMLPDGVPTSNEHLAGKDIMQSHETCDITDYTWAIGYLLMANGDASVADKIEKACFNAGPGAVTKDFKALQYFSGLNQVISTFESNHNKFYHGETWMAYSPVHMTECCSGNVNRFMPNFASRLWMRDKQGGLVSAFYAPSSVDFKINEANITVKEETNYPFSHEIRYEFESDKTITLPFTFRIPVWCTQPKLFINGKSYSGKLTTGKFITINLLINNKAGIKLYLPMKPELITVADNGLVVEYGPLLFAYPVPTKAEKDTIFHPNMNGKRASNPNFPAWNFFPAADWNYALLLDKNNFEKNIQVKISTTNSYAFDTNEAPIIIRVPAKKINTWNLVGNRYTPPLPEKENYTAEAETVYINLVPYGSTCLRVAVFPSGTLAK
ncbi:MAG: beta-L-arabinofuranosidase domain-containing protein [Bacteroidota bacterium]